jgi:hypothetical protein
VAAQNNEAALFLLRFQIIVSGGKSDSFADTKAVVFMTR